MLKSSLKEAAKLGEEIKYKYLCLNKNLVNKAVLFSIKYLQELCREEGIFFQQKQKDEKTAGTYSYYKDGSKASITLFKDKNPVDHRIFTFLHELGHHYAVQYNKP